MATLGRHLLAEHEKFFNLWHAFRQGTIDRRNLRAFSALNLARLEHSLTRATTLDHKAARNLGKDLLKHWDKLWVFLRVDGVEPTNNAADRALRLLVILERSVQRLSSKDGKAFFERLLSLGTTARIRGVRFYDWLLQVLRAAKLTQPIPALEPA